MGWMRYALIQKGIIVLKNDSYDCTEKNDSMIYSKNISPLAVLFGNEMRYWNRMAEKEKNWLIEFESVVKVGWIEKSSVEC